MAATKIPFEHIPAGRPLVALRFSEGQGRTAANVGVLSLERIRAVQQGNQ
jgi:hypothetical protein